MSDIQPETAPAPAAAGGPPPLPPAGGPSLPAEPTAQEAAKTAKIGDLLARLRATRGAPKDQTAQAVAEATQPAAEVPVGFAYPDQARDVALMRDADTEEEATAATNRMLGKFAAHLQSDTDARVAAGIQRARDDYEQGNQAQDLYRQQANIIRNIGVEMLGSEAKYKLVEPGFIRQMQQLTAHDPALQTDPATIGAALNAANLEFNANLQNAQNPDSGATRSRGAPASQTQPKSGAEDTRAFLRRMTAQ